jgi:hypothetical protein
MFSSRRYFQGLVVRSGVGRDSSRRADDECRLKDDASHRWLFFCPNEIESNLGGASANYVAVLIDA